MTNDRLRFLFNRYVSQTISEAERKEFFELISESESDENLRKLLDQLWNSVPEGNVHITASERIYKNVVGHAQKGKENSMIKFSFLKVAAVVGLVAIASVGVYLYSAAPLNEPIASSELVKTKIRDSFVRLPDGSSVVLNEKSKLTFPDSFDGSSTREVQLEGEGFFDIKHDPAKPFIVRSGNVVTTVLGTAFNIKAFPADQDVIVTVTRGKVEVSADQKVLGVITRDQQITVNKKSVVTNQHIVNSEETIAWMERDIFFDDITMEEAIEELENRFGVKINMLNDQIKDCRFTATFVKGEDIEQILLVICEFNKASFQWNDSGNLIEIDGAGCQ
jgi:ferric-dicitrate binding protein FerR (iron transport regulator)